MLKRGIFEKMGKIIKGLFEEIGEIIEGLFEERDYRRVNSK